MLIFWGCSTHILRVRQCFLPLSTCLPTSQPACLSFLVPLSAFSSTSPHHQLRTYLPHLQLSTFLTLSGKSLPRARQFFRFALAFPTISRKVAPEIPRPCPLTKAWRSCREISDYHGRRVVEGPRGGEREGTRGRAYRSARRNVTTGLSAFICYPSVCVHRTNSFWLLHSLLFYSLTGNLELIAAKALLTTVGLTCI